MNILIIKLAAIGDVIRTTAVLPGLREKFPDCSIAWVTKEESFDILRNNSLIQKVVAIENIKNEFDGEKFDLIISLDDDDDACKLASEIDTKKIIGAYAKNGKIAYTEDSSLWFDMGLISKFGKERADRLKAENKRTYQEIMYSILNLKYKKQEPVLVLGRKELESGKKFAKNNGIHDKNIVIGINTGAGGRWQDKKLSIGETAELIGRLNKIENAKLLLFGGPEEKDRNKKIISLEKNDLIDAGTDNSLLDFASLVNLCDVLVTSDSLAMHIGTALKKKVVAFFYPTSATEIELYSRGIKIIGKGRDYCSYKTKCHSPPKWNIGEFVDAVKSLL